MDTFKIIRYINNCMRKAGIKAGDGCHSGDEPARVFNMAERALRSQEDTIFGKHEKQMVFYRVGDCWVASMENVFKKGKK